jgi:hypothetical protein
MYRGETLDSITRTLWLIILMLKEAGQSPRAVWLEQRFREISRGRNPIKPLKEIRAFLAAMESLSDISLNISDRSQLERGEYNRVFLNLVLELDREINTRLRVPLSKGLTHSPNTILENDIFPSRLDPLYKNVFL